jgi:penicillin amidase
LNRGKKFTVADFERLQHDETSIPAREIVPLLRDIKVDDARVREAVEVLLGWDMVLSKDSPAAAIYEVWLAKLSSNVFRPAIAAEAWPLAGGRQTLMRLINALKNPDSRMFGADAKQARDRVMIKSLDEALGDLTSRLGADLKKWRWGDLHVAEFRHSLSSDEATRAVFDLGRVARGGDANTVNATAGASFRQSAGASFRQVLDLSNWDNSVATSVPGQSGQPTSPHYQDLLPLWAEGKYFPLLFSREKIEKHVKQRLMLEPRRGQ